MQSEVRQVRRGVDGPLTHVPPLRRREFDKRVDERIRLKIETSAECVRAQA
jgi:hypothetical protein